MKIACPNCAASYEVRATALGTGGRSVRCARCRTVWFAIASDAPEPAEMAARTQSAATEQAEAPADYDWTFNPNDKTLSVPAARADAPEPASPAAGEAATAEPAPASPAGESLPEVTLSEAPSVVPIIEHEPPAPEASGPSEDIETLAARRARRAKAARKKKGCWRPGLPTVIMALAIVLAGLVAFRTQVVRVAPQTASLFKTIGFNVNLRGLAIENVKTMREVHEGVMVLVVEGNIANVISHTVEVPRLRFAMRNTSGHEIYAWTSVVGRTVLGPGETAAFRTRLASPPADGREVIVRFFNRRDIVGGAQ